MLSNVNSLVITKVLFIYLPYLHKMNNNKNIILEHHKLSFWAIFRTPKFAVSYANTYVAYAQKRPFQWSPLPKLHLQIIISTSDFLALQSIVTSLYTTILQHQTTPLQVQPSGNSLAFYWTFKTLLFSHGPVIPLGIHLEVILHQIMIY